MLRLDQLNPVWKTKTICSSDALQQRSSSSFCRYISNLLWVHPPHNLIIKTLREIRETFRKTSLFC